MENIDIDKDNLKNIDIDIDMAILENIDIDKGILQNIDIDKISYRLGFGISNTPRAYSLTEERITEKKLDQGEREGSRQAGGRMLERFGAGFWSLAKVWNVQSWLQAELIRAAGCCNAPRTEILKTNKQMQKLDTTIITDREYWCPKGKTS